MGQYQSQEVLKPDTVEYFFERANFLNKNVVRVSTILKNHDERCDALVRNLLNCENWMREDDDNKTLKEILQVRAELLEEKYSRKINMKLVREAEENISQIVAFVDKLRTGKGEELKFQDRTSLLHLERSIQDRHVLGLIENISDLEKQVTMKDEEIGQIKNKLKEKEQIQQNENDLIEKQMSTMMQLQKRNAELRMTDEMNGFVVNHPNAARKYKKGQQHHTTRTAETISEDIDKVVEKQNLYQMNHPFWHGVSKSPQGLSMGMYDASGDLPFVEEPQIPSTPCTPRVASVRVGDAIGDREKTRVSGYARFSDQNSKSDNMSKKYKDNELGKERSNECNFRPMDDSFSYACEELKNDAYERKLCNDSDLSSSNGSPERDYNGGRGRTVSEGERGFKEEIKYLIQEVCDNRSDNCDWRSKRKDQMDAPKLERRKLKLKPRTVVENRNSGADNTSTAIFGGAKPVDTASREREIDARLVKEQLQQRRSTTFERKRDSSRSRQSSESDPIHCFDTLRVPAIKTEPESYERHSNAKQIEIIVLDDDLQF